MAHYSFNYPGLNDPPTSASLVAGTTGARHHGQPILLFVETKSCYVAQAGLKLLGSSDPPASASQSTWITGVSHYTQPFPEVFNLLCPDLPKESLSMLAIALQNVFPK